MPSLKEWSTRIRNNDEISFLKARIRELEEAETSQKNRCESSQRQYLDIPVAYQSLDAGGHLLEVNQTWLGNLGYSKNEVIGRSFTDFLLPSQQDHFVTHFPKLKSPREGIIIIQDERMVFLNASAIKLGGFAIERMLAEPFITFVHPNDRQSVMDWHEKRLRGKQVDYTYHFRIIRQDEMVRWLSVQGTIVEWNGRTASLLFLSDSTEHRNIEIDRQENEQNLNAILNATQESIQLFDLEGNVLLTNEAAARRLGITVKESIGRNVFAMQCFPLK